MVHCESSSQTMMTIDSNFLIEVREIKDYTMTTNVTSIPDTIIDEDHINDMIAAFGFSSTPMTISESSSNKVSQNTKEGNIIWTDCMRVSRPPVYPHNLTQPNIINEKELFKTSSASSGPLMFHSPGLSPIYSKGKEDMSIGNESLSRKSYEDHKMRLIFSPDEESREEKETQVDKMESKTPEGSPPSEDDEVSVVNHTLHSVSLLPETVPLPLPPANVTTPKSIMKKNKSPHVNNNLPIGSTFTLTLDYRGLPVFVPNSSAPSDLKDYSFTHTPVSTTTSTSTTLFEEVYRRYYGVSPVTTTSFTSSSSDHYLHLQQHNPALVATPPSRRQLSADSNNQHSSGSKFWRQRMEQRNMTTILHSPHLFQS